MDGPGHDKECPDHDNKAHVFARGMLNAGGAVDGEDVIAASGCGQERTQCLVMPLPMLPQNERKDCDQEEMNCEWSEQCMMRFDNRGAHCCLWSICRGIRFWVNQKYVFSVACRERLLSSSIEEWIKLRSRKIGCARSSPPTNGEE